MEENHSRHRNPKPPCEGGWLQHTRQGEDHILGHAESWRRGKRIKRIIWWVGQPDLFIAAQAAHHELCVVTRNTKDLKWLRCLC